jgi:hypothetical protein
MYRNATTLYLLVMTLGGLAGCSSQPSGKASEKAATPPDKIQGKAQVAQNETTATDAALNAGGPSVYLVNGMQRYRLFFKTALPVDPGKEYIAEGFNAQKIIDEIGDPDQGKNGYPLESSCNRVVRTAWPELDFAVVDSHVTTLHSRVKRYPARPVFLVTQLLPVTSKDSTETKDDQDIPEISVPADKQLALLIEGPKALSAPLWEPTASTVRCKVFITEGKVSELDTGAQLCETVPWSQFRYQPTAKGGHPVKVKTEVEVHFEPRK